MILEAAESDFIGLMSLYTQLHGNNIPPESESLQKLS